MHQHRTQLLLLGDRTGSRMEMEAVMGTVTMKRLAAGTAAAAAAAWEWVGIAAVGLLVLMSVSH